MQAVRPQRASDQLVAALKERLGEQLVAVVLFGSRALGTARPGSDWDVLVVADSLPGALLDRARLLGGARGRAGLGNVAVVLRSPEAFTSRLQSVYLDIALDGKILYDPRGVAAQRLASIRDLIRAEGLCRERTPAGDVWEKRHAPDPRGAWRTKVHTTDDARYRLGLAEAYLAEAGQDTTLHRWRSCVDNSQLAAENAAKAALALIGPVGRTHDPGVLLRRALDDGRFPQALAERVQRLSECASLLGPDIHIFVAYGDEETRRTPWDIFDEERAREIHALAEEAAGLARGLVEIS